MKAKLIFPALLLILFMGCKKDKIAELPDNISIVTPIANIIDTLKAVLPESRNVTARQPELFVDSVQKYLIIKEECYVYATFINENTSSKNSLFWYAYADSVPPQHTDEISGTILFPNISKTGDGGLLESGYTLQLGNKKFPAGTVIGFILISNGWNAGYIDYKKPTHYTNYNLNIGGMQQHVLFKDRYSKNLIIGFEDGTVFNNPNCDKDFNDVIFSVSDNKDGYEASSFDLSKIVIR